jgi:pyruvate ferredoxin oxidoreductase beta subunit
VSKEKIKICKEFYDVMPPEYQELVEDATYGNTDRGWKDIGVHKELIEEHSLCAGCPESIAFRYILASLPNPEDTVMVGSTGCTSLVFPMVAVHNIHSLFGNQNAIATGLKRALTVRFPGRIKDVVVLAGDGATVDIGLDMTLQAWFRQEKFTTICFDNELYANTGGQESGLMQKGFVAKMAPTGKKFDKVRLPEIARESGCHYVVQCTVSKPALVERVIKNAIYIAREIGPTYLQLYTPCILEIGKNSMEGLQEMRDSEKPSERFAYKEYMTDEAKQFLADLAAKKKEAAAKNIEQKPAAIPSAS